MLKNLESIDWSKLRHAHGAATDTPALLRAVASDDDEVRMEALADLHETIWHQGTVYPATAAAVPVLYELLEEPDAPGKEGIAHLIACIAEGDGPPEVRQAVSAGLRLLLPFLSVPDADLRAPVAAALGGYPEHASWLLPALTAALAAEAKENVREILSESQARLETSS